MPQTSWLPKGSATIGYVEAKDIGKNLDDVEQGKVADGERFSRYLNSLTNLILTDYLEFRWYIDGDLRDTKNLGMVTKDGKIKPDKVKIQEVAELLVGDFPSHKPEGVGTPKELAEHMARLAHRIHKGVEEALDKQIASELLTGLRD